MKNNKNIKNKNIGLFGVLVVGGCALSDYTPPAFENTGGGGGQGGEGQGGEGQGGDGGGAGQGGAMTGCVPSSTQDCYSGPPGTESVGSCHKGVQMCDATSMWGKCLGQIVPVLEDCKAHVDLNCDSLTNCSGVVRDTRVYSVTDKDDAVFSVAVGASPSLGVEGTIYAGGISLGGTDPATGQLNTGRVLLTQRRADWTIVDWAEKFGTASPSYAYVTGLATLPGTVDDVAVVGNFRGTLSAGGAMYTGGLAQNAFVAVIGGDGQFRYMKYIPSSAGVLTRAVGADSAGNVYVVGAFSGVTNFGNGELTAVGLTDGFVVSYDVSGILRWQKTMNGPGLQSVETVAVTPTGNVAIGGVFENQCIFDGGSVTTSQGGFDIMVANLASTGAINWAVYPGGPGDQNVRSVAFGPNNLLLMTGGYRGSLNTDAGALTGVDPAPNMPGQGDWDFYVGGLELVGGKVQAITGYSALGTQLANSIAVDVFGDILLTGVFSGAVNLGGMTIASTSETDVNVFAAKFSIGVGGPLWVKQFGDMQSQTGFSVAATPAFAHAIVGGAFRGKLTGAQSEPVSAGSSTDAFVLDLAP